MTIQDVKLKHVFETRARGESQYPAKILIKFLFSHQTVGSGGGSNKVQEENEFYVA